MWTWSISMVSRFVGISMRFMMIIWLGVIRFLVMYR